MKNISNWLRTIIVYISKSEDPISVTIKITYGVQSLKSGYTNNQSNDFGKFQKQKYNQIQSPIQVLHCLCQSVVMFLFMPGTGTVLTRMTRLAQLFYQPPRFPLVLRDRMVGSPYPHISVWFRTGYRDLTTTSLSLTVCTVK